MLKNDTNFLKTVITGDETWTHNFDPLTKSATSAKKHTDSLYDNEAPQTGVFRMIEWLSSILMIIVLYIFALILPISQMNLIAKNLLLSLGATTLLSLIKS